MITPYMLRRRPDQTSYELNKLEARLNQMTNSIKVVSKTGDRVIIIGEQPNDKPFGIHTYNVKGDKLEEI